MTGEHKQKSYEQLKKEAQEANKKAAEKIEAIRQAMAVRETIGETVRRESQQK